MATIAQVAKSKKKPKYSTRVVRRCGRIVRKRKGRLIECGRKRGYNRDFNLCRICLRELGNAAYIPGLRKSSW